jgi:hypothetical protein
MDQSNVAGEKAEPGWLARYPKIRSSPSPRTSSLQRQTTVAFKWIDNAA